MIWNWLAILGSYCKNERNWNTRKIKLKWIEEKLRLIEREKEKMDEKRRIEEMQMQLKMKELELDFVREK